MLKITLYKSAETKYCRHCGRETTHTYVLGLWLCGICRRVNR